MNKVLHYLFSFVYNYNPEFSDDEDEPDNVNNRLKKYLEIKSFENIENVLKKKIQIIKRKRVIKLKSEELLETFCLNKCEIANQNILDWKFEKCLSNEIHDPYVYTVEHSFTEQECDSMIAQFEKEYVLHYNGVTGGGYTPNVKRTREIGITREQTWQKWNSLCFKRLNEALQKYAKHCVDTCHNDSIMTVLHGNGIINDTGYQLQKYMKEHQFYKWHQDSSLKPGHNEHRIITYLWYLNTVEEGGETYFYHGKVKPEKGKLILFPACWNYNHKGATPISHDKYIITGWVYSNI